MKKKGKMWIDGETKRKTNISVWAAFHHGMKHICLFGCSMIETGHFRCIYPSLCIQYTSITTVMFAYKCKLDRFYMQGKEMYVLI